MTPDAAPPDLPLGFRPNLDGFADVQLDLVRHVNSRTEGMLAENRALERLRTAEDLWAYQAHVRAAVIDGLGGLVGGAGASPAEPPPTQWLGTIRTATHTVERLIIESLPGVFVTANLYRPLPPAGPDRPKPEARPEPEPEPEPERRPAVLFLCGHLEAAKADPEYQEVCAHLAQAGFVVLILDPWGQGERHGYPGTPESAPVAPGTTEHTYAGIGSWWLGESPARYFVHDARRALDFLASLPEVDPSRLGVTGNSGGGTLCTLLMAVEPRIAAAAVGTFVTSRGAYLWSGQRQDAEQILLGGTRAGVDHADLVAVLAPRPVAVLAADFDFFPIEGTLETLRRAQFAFDAAGAPHALSLTRAATTHRYAPELARAAVKFFTRWLGRPEATGPQPGFAPLASEDLRCTPTGQIFRDRPGARFLHDLTAATYRALPEPSEAHAIAWLHERVFADRRPPAATLARWLPGPAGTRHGMWRSEVDLWGAGVLLPPAMPGGEPSLGVPRPLPDDGRAVRVVIVLSDRGSAELTHAEGNRLRSGLLTPGDAEGGLVETVTLVLDVRGHGALTPYDRDGSAVPATSQASSTYKALADLLWLGDSLAAGRVYDVTRAIDVLLGDQHLAADHPGLCATSPVHIVGSGAGAFLATLTAAVDTRVTTVSLANHSVVDLDRVMTHRYYDEGRGSWQYVVPGLARHAPPHVLRRALGARLVTSPPPGGHPRYER